MVRSTSKATLAERAYQVLEEQIVTLRLKPGAATSEAALSRKFGIGRMPVREALQRLARERLITILPRRGILIADINVSAHIRLLEVRREIERLLAAAAAKRASAAQRDAFTRIAKEMAKAAKEGDDLLFMRADRAFNGLVLDAAQNEFAADAMTAMGSLSRRFWYRHYQEAADLPVAAKLHAKVAMAIAARDARGAAKASDQLIDYLEDFARATVT